MALCVIPQTAHATFSGGNGRIAYRSGGAVYSVGTDGSGGAVQLATGTMWTGSPSWSPDGTKIAYIKDYDLYVMDADGSNKSLVFDDARNKNHVAYGADGTYLVFHSYDARSANLRRIGLVGGGEIDLTPLTPEREDSAAELSADGTIVFRRDPYVATNRGDIYIVGGATLTPDTEGKDETPSISPDGSFVVFARNGDIYSIPSIGGSEVALTTGAYSSNPLVSPDGTKIAFVSSPPGGFSGLYTMSLDGSNKTFLTGCSGCIEMSWQAIPIAVSGHVTRANGDAAEGVEIALSGAASDTTTTGADGSYTFSGLTNGTYAVTIQGRDVDAFEITTCAGVVANGACTVDVSATEDVDFHLLREPLVVNVTGDGTDTNTGDDVCDSTAAVDGSQCSLRAAIQEANARVGNDDITFEAGLTTISPQLQLPDVTEVVTVTGPAEIDGSGAGAADGLTLAVGGARIDTLALNNFSGAAVAISAGVSSRVTRSTMTGNGSGIDLLNGANADIATPQLTYLQGTTVAGNVAGTSGTVFTIEVFAASCGDDSPQGSQYLASFEATADSSGVARFTGELPSPATRITATATSVDGTSEFAPVRRREIQASSGASVAAATCTGDDLDGDAIPDQWEKEGSGYDADHDGAFDIDLFELGARSDHRDVFVEIDKHSGSGFTQNSLDIAVQRFADAPIANIDGTSGIHLHIDNGSDSKLHYSTTLQTWGEKSGSQLTNQSILSLTEGAGHRANANWFVAARKPIFHYGLAGVGIVGGAAGTSTGVPSDSMTFARPALCPATLNCTPKDEANASLFMHELGHNLGLWHNGEVEENFVPNYMSIMNYRFTMSGIPHSGSGGTEWATDYSRLGYRAGDTVMDEGSDGTLLKLDESALDEHLGFGGVGVGAPSYMALNPCVETESAYVYRTVSPNLVSMTGPVDFDCDGAINDTPVSNEWLWTEPMETQQINSDVHGYNDWSRLKFGGGSIGRQAAVAGAANTPVVSPAPSILLRYSGMNQGDTTAPRVAVTVVRVKRKRVIVRFTTTDNRELHELCVKIAAKTTCYPAKVGARRLVRTLSLVRRKRAVIVRFGAVDDIGFSSKVRTYKVRHL